MIRWAPWRTAWFVLTGVPALTLAPAALSVETAVVGAALGFGTFLLGHTVGLHRGILHRAFAMPRWLRNLLAWVFVLVGLGGPMWWMRAHNLRDHWQSRPDAPAWFRYDHGLLRDFVWNLHTQWDGPRPARLLRPDDAADPWLRFLERTWVLHVAASFAVLYALGGLPHLLVGGFARVWLAQLGHWYVGYEAHARGSVRYPMDPAAVPGRNRWLLGVLSLGEGFHNNHHAFPGAARIGHRWWEFDAGWGTIRLLAALGLVWDVVSVRDGTRARPAREWA